MIPTDTGETDCTVTVTDANGNIPSNLESMGTRPMRIDKASQSSLHGRDQAASDENLTTRY